MWKIKNRLKINFIALLSASLLSGCSPINSIEPFDQKQATILLKQIYKAKPAKQMIALTLPNQPRWKKIDISEESLGQPFMLVPVNQNETNWQENISTAIAGFVHTPHLTLKEFVNNEFKRADKMCSQVKTNLIQQNTDSVIFTLDLSNCHDRKNQLQIGKAFLGGDAIYAVRYTALSQQVSEKHFAKMAKAIEMATLVNNTAYHR